jgi:hypothetical protein
MRVLTSASKEPPRHQHRPCQRHSICQQQTGCRCAHLITDKARRQTICLAQALPLASRFLLASTSAGGRPYSPGGESKHYSGKVGNRAATRNGLASGRSGTLQSDHRSVLLLGRLQPYILASRTSAKACSSVPEARHAHLFP